MNQQNKGTSSCAVSELPMKRKRGRPRKDKSPEKEYDIPDNSEFESMTTEPAEADPVGDTEDNKVGQVVSGVLEGSFDAGYFITVKAGNTDTVLKGLVFLPSKITPLTAANDVAPQAKLYTRKDIPIPPLKAHTEPQISIPRSQQHDKPVVDVDHRMPTEEENAVINQAPDAGVSLGDRTFKNDNQLPAGTLVTPQCSLEFSVHNPSASVLPQVKDSGIVEQEEQFKIALEPSVGMNLELSSALSGNVVPNVETSNQADQLQVPNIQSSNQADQLQHRAEKFDSRVENIVHPDTRNSNDELNTCCNSDNPEGISKKQGTDGEVLVCSKIDIATDTQPSSVSETLNGDDTSCCDKKPVNHEADTSQAGPVFEQSISQTCGSSQAEFISSEHKGTNDNSFPETIDARISSTSGRPMDVKCAAEGVAPPKISANLCQQTQQSGNLEEQDTCNTNH